MKVRRLLTENYEDMKPHQLVSNSDEGRVLSDIDVFEDIEDQLYDLAFLFISNAGILDKIFIDDYDDISDLRDTILANIKNSKNKSSFLEQSDRILDGFIANYGTRLSGGYGDN